MNITLLTLSVLCRWSARWPLWGAPVAALGILSFEMQTLSLLGASLSLRQLAMGHAAVAALLVCIPACRASLIRNWCALRRDIAEVVAFLASPSRRFAMLGFLIVAGVLVVRAILFVAESADPYHLVRVSLISTTHTLRPVAVEDWKVNAFGYLYELMLADLIGGMTALQPWISVPSLILPIIYVGLIAWRLRLAGNHVTWLGLLLPCMMPVIFHQGVLLKNDMFAAILLLPVLFGLHDGLTDRRRIILAGTLIGLALSVKTAMFPAAMALALFLPWSPIRLALAARFWAVLGCAAGAIVGGLAFVAAQNAVVYGTIVGPLTRDGNVNNSAGEAGMSLARFAVSWFDLGLLVRYAWPGRGGWGGTFGLALAWATWVLIARSRGSPIARRALAVMLVGLVPFGLVYPDADAAHRMAIAPAAFAVTIAASLEARRRTGRPWPWSAVTALVSVVVAAGLITRSAVAYFGQIEYLRSTTLARSLEPSPGHLASKLPWNLREARARLGQAKRVCTIMQENALATLGYRFDAVVVTEATPNGSRLVWRPEVISQCDVIIVGPHRYPNANPATQAALLQCSDTLTAANGNHDGVQVVICGSR